MFRNVLDVEIYRKEAGSWSQVTSAGVLVGSDMLDEENVITIMKSGETTYEIMFPTLGERSNYEYIKRIMEQENVRFCNCQLLRPTQIYN